MHVRFAPKADKWADVLGRPLCANGRHMQCSKIAEKGDERAPFHRPTLISGKAHKNHIRGPRLRVAHN